jgi:uncharacterized protein YdcH (DUF465 family)
MAGKEEALIEKLARENEEFSKAREAHSELAKMVDELEKKTFRTPQEEMEVKMLKKKKLAYKDRMEQILRSTGRKAGMMEHWKIGMLGCGETNPKPLWFLIFF